MQIKAEAVARPEVKGGILVHEVQQDEKPSPLEQEQNDRCFDPINIKYLNFDNVKSVIFTKLELSTSQERCAYHTK